MSERRIIAVVGATGAQGGGLARAILKDPDGGFGVRALTRNIHSSSAQELARMGAEVVAADVEDPANIGNAFDGAYGAFCVTFFWEHLSVEKEMTQAKAMAEAAQRSGLKHVIWSTLEDTRKWVPLDDDRMPTLGGHFKVPHFDGKGEADGYFRALGVPTTFLLTSYYWDNFIHFGMGPKRGPDGNLSLVFPMGDKKLPGIAAEDIGKCAYGIFKRPSEYIGQTVGVAGEHLTGDQMAAEFTRVLGEPVSYLSVSPEAYRNFGFPGAEDLGNMFQFKRDFQSVFCGARSIEESRILNPDLQTLRRWLEQNRQRIPIE